MTIMFFKILLIRSYHYFKTQIGFKWSLLSGLFFGFEITYILYQNSGFLKQNSSLSTVLIFLFIFTTIGTSLYWLIFGLGLSVGLLTCLFTPFSIIGYFFDNFREEYYLLALLGILLASVLLLPGILALIVLSPIQFILNYNSVNKKKIT